MHDTPTCGVSTVILDEGEGEGRILLQKRADFRNWSLPGGRVEPGESVEAAAVREAFEETGLEVRLVRKVGDYWKPQHNDTVTVFQAKIIGGQIVQSSAETLDVRWFEVGQLPWMTSTMKRYIADTLARYADPVTVTVRISPVEVLVRKMARRVYRLAKR
ncbi:MAG: NUDIX domain-containing protein [Chloroflexota bacterium]